MLLKKLFEKRAELVTQMNAIIALAGKETRAISEDEKAKFDALEKEVEGIDATIKAEKRARDLGIISHSADEPAPADEKRAELEEKVFEAYIRGQNYEQRAADTGINLAIEDGKATVPSTIANKIIDKVVEICPIFSMSDVYRLSGELQIPLYDDEKSDIEMDYSEDFVELQSTSGKFKSITLKGFLAGSLTKIGRRLINHSQFDIVNFVINKMSQIISRFIEKQLLIGKEGKIEGLKGVKLVVTTKAKAAITSDELIDLQDKIIDAFQNNSIFIMNRATRSLIRKLKDNDGNYLLNRDLSAKWNYTLLGKDVYTSDNMPTIAKADDTPVIFYGDMKGLATKVTDAVSIDVLREKYATQHAIGIVGWTEFDAKVQNTQMIAALKMGKA